MTIENPQLVTFLIFVTAGLVLLQTALIFAYIWVGRTILQRLDAKMDGLSTRSREVLHLAAQAAAAAENLSSKVLDLHVVAQERIRETFAIIQRADRQAAGQLDYLRSRLEKVNDGTDALLSKFTVQTFKVHRAVLDPSMRLSAILKGALTAIRKAFSREDGSPAAHLPDRPDFI